MTQLRDRFMKTGDQRPSPSPLALPRELTRVTGACIKHGAVLLPVAVGQELFSSPMMAWATREERLRDALGERALRLFDDLGPIYGKAGQVLLSRLTPELHAAAAQLRLTRLYKDWPPLPFHEVEAVLDHEIPRWRTHLTVAPAPLGVASLAQVHAATDSAGRSWVVKIIKPQARRRLLETVAALEQTARLLRPLAVTRLARRGVKEMRELAAAFRRELSLTAERETIDRVRSKMVGRRQKLLVIPEVNADFCSDAVLTVERFVGTSLADVVAGKVALPAASRSRLARGMLAELLVQVFELGLFHADPHAGNLILMEDGTVGIFDWGLAGELRDHDRRHIAHILRAIVSLDLEELISALKAMGDEAGKEVSREAIRSELKSVIDMIKPSEEQKGNRPSLQVLFEACLAGAERLGIPVPDGLLLMAKSLITIEGLARGIDPDVALARVAAPVLFKAAQPGLKDLWSLGRSLPRLARQLWRPG